MIDRNSKEFEQMIEIPLGQLFNVKGGIAEDAGVGALVAATALTGAVVAAGASPIIYAGYKIYKNYISKAGVACKNNPNRRRKAY